VVVDAEGERKRTGPLAGVNGEVYKEKGKKLWKERKKDLTPKTLLEMDDNGETIHVHFKLAITALIGTGNTKVV
jgi:hypothetical protein